MFSWPKSKKKNEFVCKETGEHNYTLNGAGGEADAQEAAQRAETYPTQREEEVRRDKLPSPLPLPQERETMPHPPPCFSPKGEEKRAPSPLPLSPQERVVALWPPTTDRSLWWKTLAHFTAQYCFLSSARWACRTWSPSLIRRRHGCRSGQAARSFLDLKLSDLYYPENRRLPRWPSGSMPPSSWKTRIVMRRLTTTSSTDGTAVSNGGALKLLGAEVCYVPHRVDELRLNCAGRAFRAPAAGLLTTTVDWWRRSVVPAECGLELIITDHHRPELARGGNHRPSEDCPAISIPSAV